MLGEMRRILLEEQRFGDSVKSWCIARIQPALTIYPSISRLSSQRCAATFLAKRQGPNTEGKLPRRDRQGSSAVHGGGTLNR